MLNKNTISAKAFSYLKRHHTYPSKDDDFQNALNIAVFKAFCAGYIEGFKIHKKQRKSKKK